MDGRISLRMDARSFGRHVCALILALILVAPSAWAAPAYPGVITEKQPDGAAVQLRLRGDEHFSWLEDTEGYTVVRERGWFRYAELDRATGRLKATKHVAGQADPRALGLEKRVLPSAAVRAEGAKRNPGQGQDGGGESASLDAVAPSGTVKNLVVLVRFSNHTTRSLPSRADVDVLFNAVGGDPVLAPTGSIRDVYYENSYGQMVLDSSVQDWVTVSGTEAYYANGNSGDSTLWQALRQALQAIDATVNFSDYDTDNDGWIDSIAFLHSGYAAEWGGSDSYGTPYTSRIWSHRWSLQPAWTSAEGVRVGAYHISPAVWGVSGSEIGRIGVIAHETGHFFGLPDLYDTDSSPGEGIGSWGLMANSWDFNYSQRCPPHFSPWSKERLGWYQPTVIDQPGQYVLNEAESFPEVFKISAGFPSNEYLLIENRQNSGFDCTIPQGGLLIWHIDENAGYNAQGWPGQSGWPGNGQHYKVAVLQADGNYDLEKGNNRGDAGDTHHALGVDAIGPGPGNYPNTDAYQSGNVYPTGHLISNISVSGPSMSFCLQSCGGLPAPGGLNASALGSGSIGLAWSDNSADETGFRLERSLDGSNWSLRANLGANVTGYTDTGLASNTTYLYRVRAFNATETSGWSNVASATTDPLPPAAPSNLGATAMSESRIDLAWQDNANNESGYRVDRSTNQVNWTTIANLGANATTYSNTGLSAATTYYYRVSANNSAGSSAYASAQATTDEPPPYVDYVSQSGQSNAGTVSGTHTATHSDNGQAQQITEVQSGGRKQDRHSLLEYVWTFNIGSGASVSLTANAWSGGSSDGDMFAFAWSTNGSTWNTAFTVSSTSSSNVQMATLPASTSGTVYVRVRDTNRARGAQALDRVYVDHLYIRVNNGGASGGNPPAAPSSLNASAASASSIALSWSDNSSDETGFNVERSSNGGASWQQVASPAAGQTSWSDSGLQPNSTYLYRVRAFNASGASGWSNTASATTAAASALSLSANGYKSKGVQHVALSWSGAGSANVDIFRDGAKIATTPNDGSYTDNLNQKGGGVAYRYKVCEQGSTVCSNEVTVGF